MKRLDIVVFFLVILGAAYYFHQSHKGAVDSGPWSASSFPSETIDLKVVPPISFEGKTKADILKLRDEAKARDPRLRPLLAATPQPSLLVAATQDGKPWRGLAGELWRLDVSKGEAVDSVCIVNPFLLCALRYCVSGTDLLPTLDEAKANPNFFRLQVLGDLLPVGLTLDGPKRHLTAKYQLQPGSPLAKMAANLGPNQGLIYLENTNAADLGWLTSRSIPRLPRGFTTSKATTPRAKALTFASIQCCRPIRSIPAFRIAIRCLSKPPATSPWP